MPSSPSTHPSPPGKPDKGGGYAEPVPDRKRGDEAEDAFDADFEQGRDTTRDRDGDKSRLPTSEPGKKSGRTVD